jgi:hypothetical protein
MLWTRMPVAPVAEDRDLLSGKHDISCPPEGRYGAAGDAIPETRRVQEPADC